MSKPKDNITSIDALKPHRLGEVICIKCHYRWFAVWPDGVWLKELECGGCHEIGYVIETGEVTQ